MTLPPTSRRLRILPVVLTPLLLTSGCLTSPSDAPPAAATDAYAKGVIAYNAGNTPEAKSKLIAATQVSGDLINARSLLGDIFRAEGDYKAALDQYEVVVRLDPKSPSSHYRLGVVYQFLSRFLEARDAYRETIALAPSPTTEPSDASPSTTRPSPTLIDAYMNLGLVDLALDDLPAAVEHTRTAVTLSTPPGNPVALTNYGVVLDAINDHVGAQRAYTTALELSPDNPATLTNLAQNLLTQNRPKEAQEVLQRLLKTNESPLIRKRLGDAFALQGQAPEAIEQYERAIKLDPNYLPAYNEAGRVFISRYRATGELNEALRDTALGYWKRSLALNPTQPQIQALIAQWQRARP